MNEFQYVIDENGDKTAVIIDLTRNKDVWEEFSHLWLRKHKSGRLPVSSFGRLFDKHEVEEISKAIVENCENIDNEW